MQQIQWNLAMLCFTITNLVRLKETVQAVLHNFVINALVRALPRIRATQFMWKKNRNFGKVQVGGGKSPTIPTLYKHIECPQHLPN